jgi:hypothetical protein
MVKIVDIREDVGSMASSIRNAFIDFSKVRAALGAAMRDTHSKEVQRCGADPHPFSPR